MKHCRLIHLFAALLLGLARLSRVEGAALYEMSVISARTPLQQFATSNRSACFSACTGSVGAVSFSKALGLCLTSMCANIKLEIHAMWSSYICVNPLIVGCDLPTPLFEWMLTDTCTSSNLASVNSGWQMSPAYNLTSLTSSPYSASTTLPLFGHPMQYYNATGYHWITSMSPVTVNTSDSLTLFGYFIISSPSLPSFPIIEFGTLNNGVYTGGPGLWVLGGNIFYNFANAPLACAACYGNVFVFTAVNQWIPVALVYNKAQLTFTVYYNGSLVYTNTLAAAPSGVYNGNVVITSGRPKPAYTSLLGSTYCIKVFAAALSAFDLSNIAKACMSGQIRVF